MEDGKDDEARITGVAILSELCPPNSSSSLLILILHRPSDSLPVRQSTVFPSRLSLSYSLTHSLVSVTLTHSILYLDIYIALSYLALFSFLVNIIIIMLPLTALWK